MRIAMGRQLIVSLMVGAAFATAVPDIVSRRSARRLVVGRSRASFLSSLSAAAVMSDDQAIALYRAQALQYERDAAEAEAAAQKYAKMTEQASREGQNFTAQRTLEELTRLGVPDLARKVEHVAGLMSNPRPLAAAAAGKQARLAYDERYREYSDARSGFDQRASEYLRESRIEREHADQLKAYADQQQLEGIPADNYEGIATAATQLSLRAGTLARQAVEYREEEGRLRGMLPNIEKWAAMAETHARWVENPAEIPGPEGIYAHTAAPLLSDVQPRQVQMPGAQAPHPTIASLAPNPNEPPSGLQSG